MTLAGTAGTGLRIGVSAAFFHADPQRPLFKGKTLAYIEQDLAHWLMVEGALPYLIPAPHPSLAVDVSVYARDLDGLVLQGGVDVAPGSYGEEPLRPEWSGDRIRDAYELALLHVFIEHKKPILGVCRGAQLLNVAMGGTLYQDITTQMTGARVHRDWEVYERNVHELTIEPGGHLSALYPDVKRARVCSVHHQGVKDLGRDLDIEARSADDGVIEAIRRRGQPWVFGVQWHPEWHPMNDASLLDGGPLLRSFLTAARWHREQNIR